MIDISNIYTIFPTELSYKEYLYNIKLAKTNSCPYCYSNKITLYKSIFHCNLCNSKFSITTKTIMHKSRIDYRKWLISIYLFLFNENISYRKLSKIINVNKNTAYSIIKKLIYLYSNFKLDIIKLTSTTLSNIEILSNILLIRIK